MDYSRPSLADRLAAEYATGTLRGAARRRFEALLPAHATLRSALDAWQARLAPLTRTITPIEPPASVWTRIESRLWGARQGADAAPLRWWQQLAFWRGLSAMAGVATLSLAILLATPDPARPPVVVVLNAAASAAGTPAPQPPTFVASISADGRAMVTRPLQAVALQPDRALELWAVPPSGAPRSLGVISANGVTVVRQGRVLDNTSALAVTLEPPGGSPTGKPTGPILYSGALVL